tara:strand:+ start:4045 stop:4383 length:339 start_codon:yes stop_codon:yes gene_type:complete
VNIKIMGLETVQESNTCVTFDEVVAESEKAMLFKFIDAQGIPTNTWLPKKMLANYREDLALVWVWDKFIHDIAGPAQTDLLRLNEVPADEAIATINTSAADKLNAMQRGDNQ